MSTINIVTLLLVIQFYHVTVTAFNTKLGYSHSVLGYNSDFTDPAYVDPEYTRLIRVNYTSAFAYRAKILKTIEIRETRTFVLNKDRYFYTDKQLFYLGHLVPSFSTVYSNLVTYHHRSCIEVVSDVDCCLSNLCSLDRKIDNGNLTLCLGSSVHPLSNTIASGLKIVTSFTHPYDRKLSVSPRKNVQHCFADDNKFFLLPHATHPLMTMDSEATIVNHNSNYASITYSDYNVYFDSLNAPSNNYYLTFPTNVRYTCSDDLYYTKNIRALFGVNVFPSPSQCRLYYGSFCLDTPSSSGSCPHDRAPPSGSTSFRPTTESFIIRKTNATLEQALLYLYRSNATAIKQLMGFYLDLKKSKNFENLPQSVLLVLQTLKSYFSRTDVLELLLNKNSPMIKLLSDVTRDNYHDLVRTYVKSLPEIYTALFDSYPFLSVVDNIINNSVVLSSFGPSVDTHAKILVDYLLNETFKNRTVYHSGLNSHTYGNFITDAFIAILRPFFELSEITFRTIWDSFAPILQTFLLALLDLVIEVLLDVSNVIERFIKLMEPKLEKLVNLIIKLLKIVLGAFVKLFVFFDTEYYVSEIVVIAVLLNKHSSSFVIVFSFIFVLVLVVGITRHYPSLVVYLLNDEFKNLTFTTII